jgi:antitoxin VapB
VKYGHHGVNEKNCFRRRLLVYTSMLKAKVFMNGRSQAIRLPKEFRVQSKEVILKRTEGGFLVLEEDPWAAFDEGCRRISGKTLKRPVQPPLEKRERLE